MFLVYRVRYGTHFIFSRWLPSCLNMKTILKQFRANHISASMWATVLKPLTLTDMKFTSTGKGGMVDQRALLLRILAMVYVLASLSNHSHKRKKKRKKMIIRF